MTDDYRPTDYLAVCRMSYGVGYNEDAAVMNALRYAGPFDADDDTVTVSVWELYADSWQSHGLSGPERGAEQLSYTEYEIPVDAADEASGAATDAYVALDRALGDAEAVKEVDGPAGADE